ncbi:hypothetical protein RJ40_02350 [Methanofollis aquaemaris]|uniref:Uncharacterized protein n=1 Tax=Methanofollis aquaemaris TaxID=126734 RepID=A0A8A3S2J4_9EURY|nr:hypothetical protein [Methanofollis aquaemaris]QSZ66418.1 hypothetical protein RJ40_02350 [Methanofollis aquaemaris]
MTLNPLKIIRKAEPINVILFGRDASTCDIKKLRIDGEFVHDYAKDRTYGPLRQPAILSEDHGPLYPFDADTGAPLWITRSDDVFTLKTDPRLMNRLIDKRMLADAVNREVRFGALILTAITAFCVGISVALSIG